LARSALALCLGAGLFLFLALVFSAARPRRPAFALEGTPTPTATDAPGVAFQIRFLLPSTTVPCGNSPQIIVRITDRVGVPVPNGTTVVFAADVGTITPQRITNGGNATALFSAPPLPGAAHITVTAAGASADTTLQIICASPPEGGSASPTAGAEEATPLPYAGATPARQLAIAPPALAASSPEVAPATDALSDRAGTITPPNTGNGGVRPNTRPR
jgi:hypothetical protein